MPACRASAIAYRRTRSECSYVGLSRASIARPSALRAGESGLELGLWKTLDDSTVTRRPSAIELPCPDGGHHGSVATGPYVSNHMYRKDISLMFVSCAGPCAGPQDARRPSAACSISAQLQHDVGITEIAPSSEAGRPAGCKNLPIRGASPSGLSKPPALPAIANDRLFRFGRFLECDSAIERDAHVVQQAAVLAHRGHRATDDPACGR